jgi:hypothetical protein
VRPGERCIAADANQGRFQKLLTSIMNAAGNWSAVRPQQRFLGLRAHANADGLEDALTDKPNYLVNACRRALSRKAQMAHKPPAFDANVVPRPDREVLVVVEQRNRVLAELAQVPASRIDDGAVAIERAVAHDVLKHVATGRLFDLADHCHSGLPYRNRRAS